MRTGTGKVTVRLAWLLAIILLILSGVGYRGLASLLSLVVKTPVVLPVSLDFFPMQIGNWVGRDVPIPPNIQRAAGNDSSLNRLYTNELNNQWSNIYIAYTARPRTMLGHRPQVCYPGGGWVHDSTESSMVISNTGREIPCLIHRFHVSSPEYKGTVVLNFYIVNGQLTSDESVFSGVGWRTPNIGGDPAHYVTQVQISSVLENSARAVAKDMTEIIMGFFPDGEGNIGAVEYTDTPSGVPK